MPDPTETYDSGNLDAYFGLPENQSISRALRDKLDSLLNLGGQVKQDSIAEMPSSYFGLPKGF